MKATQLSRTKLLCAVNSGIPKKYSCDSFDKQIIKPVISQFYAEKTLSYIKDIHKIIPENENLN
jgi:hypothetical protein